jgi:3',5'-cyclic AMP phosphodiesterase CpdA
VVAGRLVAISDLHVGYAENRVVVDRLVPEADGDWLLLAGDLGEIMSDVDWALRTLAGRYAKVFWAPGNHELWTPRQDPVTLRGEARYRHLVELARGLGVVTPEDPYEIWTGDGGPVTVVPLFLGYDYTFRPAGVTRDEALARAYEAGVVCTDEVLLHPDPYPSRDAWCVARVEATLHRLDERDTSLPTVLVNHYPLVRQPTRILRHPEFAIWCGTELTADWHTRFDATVMVYGHLHIPRTTWHDGVRFEEVSLGYPREWQPRGPAPRPRHVLAAGPGSDQSATGSG